MRQEKAAQLAAAIENGAPAWVIEQHVRELIVLHNGASWVPNLDHPGVAMMYLLALVMKERP